MIEKTLDNNSRIELRAACSLQRIGVEPTAENITKFLENFQKPYDLEKVRKISEELMSSKKEGHVKNRRYYNSEGKLTQIFTVDLNTISLNLRCLEEVLTAEAIAPKTAEFEEYVSDLLNNLGSLFGKKTFLETCDYDGQFYIKMELGLSPKGGGLFANFAKQIEKVSGLCRDLGGMIYQISPPDLNHPTNRLRRLVEMDLDLNFYPLLNEMTGVTKEKILSEKKNRSTSSARATTALYLRLKYNKKDKLSFPLIGKILGGKNHATVILSIRRLNEFKNPQKYIDEKDLPGFIRECWEAYPGEKEAYLLNPLKKQ